MRAIVVGAGQMGSLYGAALLENDHEVWFYDANGLLVEALDRDGLRIKRNDGRLDAYTIRATTDPAALPSRVDLAIFLVKGYGTRDAAARVRGSIAPKTVVLTLQNGLGNEELLRDSYPGNPLLIGMSTHTVVSIAPGHVAHTGCRETYLGPSDGRSTEWAEEAGAALRRPTFPVEVLAEAAIRTQQWGKFVANCAVLPVSALTRLRIDVLIEQPLAYSVMDDLVRETCAIAGAEGIDLEPEERVAFLHDLLARAGGRASMLGDVMAGRATEIDSINGAALAYADQHAVPAPLNRAVYALVKGLERGSEVGEG